MASGSPSSRAQIPATAWAFSSVSSKLGRTAWARSTNSRTASHRPRASGSGVAPGRQGQRRHHQLLLPPERERDPGGGQHREPGGGGEQLLDHRAGLPPLLEVVGHEQEQPVAEVVAQRLQDGAAGCLGDPQGPGRRSSRPVPSSIATTPSSATTAQRMPAGESSALPDPTHSAAATATAITPLSTAVAMTPGFRVRSSARRSGPAGGGWFWAGMCIRPQR
jgi:hypothetical protein